MKKKCFKVLVVVVFCLLPSFAFAGEDVKFVFEFDPLSVLVSPDLDGFYVSDSGYYSYFREEIDGTTVFAPSIHAGVGFAVNDKFEIDGMVGYGWYFADVIESDFLTVKAVGRFTFNRFVTLGIEAGYVSFSGLEWDGEWANDNDISFSDSNGVLFGVSFTAGIEQISFNMSVEYMKLDESDITTRNGWNTSSNKLDLSGVLVNFGITCRF